MKKLTVKKGTQCMACLECVRACSEAFYKEFDPSKACLQIIERNGAAKPMVCVQCGKCAEACEHGAITQDRRVHDQQEALRRLRQVQGRMSVRRAGEGRRGTQRFEVHRLRHLRQGMSDGNSRGCREIIIPQYIESPLQKQRAFCIGELPVWVTRGFCYESVKGSKINNTTYVDFRCIISYNRCNSKIRTRRCASKKEEYL